MKKLSSCVSILLNSLLLVSSFFFLFQTTCSVSSPVSGAFCAVEKMSPPISHSPDDVHLGISAPEILVALLVIFLVTSSQIIFIKKTASRAFTKRLRTNIIRYGPHQRLFLPTLAATHGM